KLTFVARPADALELEGQGAHEVSVPAHGLARVAVRARARRAARVHVEVKLTAPNEDETATRTATIAAPALEPAGATLAWVGSDVAANGSAELVAPVASHVRVVVATPAALLGDLVAELARPGEDPVAGFVATWLARRAL